LIEDAKSALVFVGTVAMVAIGGVDRARRDGPSLAPLSDKPLLPLRIGDPVFLNRRGDGGLFVGAIRPTQAARPFYGSGRSPSGALEHWVFWKPVADVH
jgi:hypothetical protein